MNLAHSTVPDRYRGVWVRTLLQTPELRDERTFVRWLQTSSWHADLRVPVAARPISPDAAEAQRASQTGFCGITRVEPCGPDEICTWERRFDFQPPGRHPDAGRMVFDGPDRVIETGVHGRYLEVWERLPGSTGRYVVLQDDHGASMLIAGRYAMHVRPRMARWPADTQPGDTLDQVLRRHPRQASTLLDFEISFGRLDTQAWTITHSTLAEREGTSARFSVQPYSADEADVRWAGETRRYRIVEWSDPAP